MQLNTEQQRALDHSPDVPPRWTDPTTGTVQVLLCSDGFDWIRGLLEGEPDAPRLHDPRNGSEYALLPVARYERFKAFFEEDPITPAEREGLFRAFGKRAGWDEPEWEEHHPLPPGRDA